MKMLDRIGCLDWTAIHSYLDTHGYACLPDLLNREECRCIADMYEAPDTHFRSTINMARYNFGRGEYKYFSYPLPDIITQLRSSFYPHLAAIANTWGRHLGSDEHWPGTLDSLLERCHRTKQLRPTPLLLRYGKGDYNCLHQDLYGKLHFPLQVIIQLSVPKEFSGGELILVEQRPRMQSRPMVVSLDQGSAAIIPVRDRPVTGPRGWRRNQIRHGVSEVTQGVRQTLGLIFHDAE